MTTDPKLTDLTMGRSNDRRVRARWIAAIVGLSAALVAVRSYLAARVPITGDEAYYWEWSRRLAFGYHDHPPMVAWIIAAFDAGAHSVYLVRLGFIGCGLLAGLVLAAFASHAAKDPAAGMSALALFSVAPLLFVAFGMATPDGPFLLFWILALYFALRAFENASTGWWVALGVAVGGAMLSRVLGVALIAGIAAVMAGRQHRHQLKSAGPWLSAATVLIVVAPWIAWNAQHHWESLDFALSRAAPTGSAASGGGPLLALALLAVGLSPGILIASAWALGGKVDVRQPWAQLVMWSSVPLVAALLALSAFHAIEVYWFLAPFAGLIAAAAVALNRARPNRTTWWLIFAPALLEALVLVTLVSEPQAASVAAERLGAPAPSQRTFEIFAYPALSRELRNKADASHAWVVSDGYGLSSAMDFYAGVPPVVVGANPQGRESRRWYDASAVPRTIFFVDRDPSTRRGVKTLLLQACSRLTPDTALHFLMDGRAHVTFYVSKCDGITRIAFRRLAHRRTWLQPARQ